MHEHLLELIRKEVPVSEEETALCYTCFEPVVIAKNTVVESAGKVPKYLYFVVSGYMRLFHVNERGDEITTHINCPPGFITAYSGFINQTKATEQVASITSCELLRITKQNLDLLVAESTAFRDFSIRVFQQSIAYNEKRSMELATLSAEERYRHLMKNNPGILQQVPLQYIASFLGMNSKSLSRIRKQLNK